MSQENKRVFIYFSFTLVFCPGEFHRQRSLEGYRPWDHKELDMTEQLSLSFSFYLFFFLINRLYILKQLGLQTLEHDTRDTEPRFYDGHSPKCSSILYYAPDSEYTLVCPNFYSQLHGKGVRYTYRETELTTGYL